MVVNATATLSLSIKIPSAPPNSTKCGLLGSDLATDIDVSSIFTKHVQTLQPKDNPTDQTPLFFSFPPLIPLSLFLSLSLSLSLALSLALSPALSLSLS